MRIKYYKIFNEGNADNIETRAYVYVFSLNK